MSILGQITLQQPKPTTPGCRYASFLTDFIDPGPSTESVSTAVFEWLKSVGSDPEKRCRSDSHLQRSGDDLISRTFTRSAPEIGNTRDADGFAVPPTPASTGSSSHRTTADAYSQSSASSTAGVCNRLYRQNNLRFNNIHI